MDTGPSKMMSTDKKCMSSKQENRIYYIEKGISWKAKIGVQFIVTGIWEDILMYACYVNFSCVKGWQ